MTELNRLYIRNAIKPLVNNIADAFTYAFMEPSVYEVKPVLRALMRGDYQAMADANSKAAGANHTATLTINEDREVQDRPPVDGGDILIPTAVPTADTGIDDE